MSDYNTVAIGTIWLTSDGLDDGRPCRVSVQGLAALQTEFRTPIVLALDNTPFAQPKRVGIKGRPVSITPFRLEDDVFADLKDEISDAIENETLIRVRIDGSLGTWDLQCMPGLAEQPETPPIETEGEFELGRVWNVTFHFTVVSITPEEE